MLHNLKGTELISRITGENIFIDVQGHYNITLIIVAVS